MGHQHSHLMVPTGAESVVKVKMLRKVCLPEKSLKVYMPTLGKSLCSFTFTIMSFKIRNVILKIEIFYPL